MNYDKITEAYGNLLKTLKEAGMEVSVSKMQVRETGDRDIFIKIKAHKAKIYILKE
jgi:hypothetical protein